MTRGRPALSIVVMGYRNEATIVASVRSAVTQRSLEEFEVIVIVSGGDRSAALVHTEFPDVTVIESPTRLMPGGARNLGIEHARGEFVAFLAADCLAEPGWVAARLARHREGSLAVASAMSASGRGAAAAASLVLLFPSRLPGRPPGVVVQPDAAAHGLSYSACLLDDLGPFDATLRVGEDTEMARRLAERGVEIWFEPAVRTAHVTPWGTVALVRDQYRRGVRSSRALQSSGRGVECRGLARTLAARTIFVLRRSYSYAPSSPMRVLALAPWVVTGILANEAGRTVGRRRTTRPASPPTTGPPLTGGRPVDPLVDTRVGRGAVAVVVTFDRPRLATGLVRTLVEEEGFAADHVVLVVNGRGGLLDRSLQERIRVLALGENRGPAGGFRAGFRYALDNFDAPWVYACEDDVELLGVPTPRVQALIRRVEHLQDRDQQPVGGVVAFGRSLRRLTGTSRPRLVDGTDPSLVPVDLSGWGASLISRRVLEAGVLPTEEWFFGFEDFDFWLRVRRAGFRLLLDVDAARVANVRYVFRVQDAAVRPHRPAPSDETWRTYYSTRNGFFLRRLHGHPGWAARNLAGTAHSFVRADSLERRAAIAAGFRDGLRGRTGRNDRYVRAIGEWPAPLRDGGT
ncbi:MAG TPA: glycosyltransferase family 2 protein [Nitriliruptorales bacterium]|nr:glycosyltransferase family 2 protein [Nitriliruptorales bacterium]